MRLLAGNRLGFVFSQLLRRPSRGRSWKNKRGRRAKAKEWNAHAAPLAAGRGISGLAGARWLGEGGLKLPVRGWGRGRRAGRALRPASPCHAAAVKVRGKGTGHRVSLGGEKAKPGGRLGRPSRGGPPRRAAAAPPLGGVVRPAPARLLAQPHRTAALQRQTAARQRWAADCQSPTAGARPPLCSAGLPDCERRTSRLSAPDCQNRQRRAGSARRRARAACRRARAAR
jgi:hypothetical protein